MADSPGCSASSASQLRPEKKDNKNADRKDLDKDRSFNTISGAARVKLSQLIQLATDAECHDEEKVNYKIVVDTVFDSVSFK